MKVTVDNFEEFIPGSWDYHPVSETHTGLWLRLENIKAAHIPEKLINRTSA